MAEAYNGKLYPPASTMNQRSALTALLGAAIAAARRDRAGMAAMRKMGRRVLAQDRRERGGDWPINGPVFALLYGLAGSTCEAQDWRAQVHGAYAMEMERGR